jgi:hypothetical protein
MRKYMSQRQRLCDFCRLRKSTCWIEGSARYRLYVLHGRDCAFVEAAQPRNRPTMSGDKDEVSYGLITNRFDEFEEPHNIFVDFQLATPRFERLIWSVTSNDLGWIIRGPAKH